MDQIKIGHFIKELRQEKGMTQEMLAARLGVSNRTVSRWETGVNMPDFDLMRELGSCFDVGVEELLDGARRETASPGAEEALSKAAEYTSKEKAAFAKYLNKMFLLSIAAMLIYLALEFVELPENGPLGHLSGFLCGVLLGISLGMLILGALYTSGYMSRVWAFKRKLLGLDK